VIGGAQIYKQFLEQGKIDKCYVTYIDEDFYCDAFFPELDKTEWREIERLDTYDKTYECSVNYIIYERSNRVSL
jgi:dihydrofolate reductase